MLVEAVARECLGETQKKLRKNYGWRPNTNCYKCSQLEHMEKICKSHQYLEAKVVEH